MDFIENITVRLGADDSVATVNSARSIINMWDFFTEIVSLVDAERYCKRCSLWMSKMFQLCSSMQQCSPYK